jgi:hypothetical protein
VINTPHKVIVVGNSSNILQVNNGNIIDSFDYVVRMGMCRIDGYELHVGSKTDLLCGTINDFFVPHYNKNQIFFQPKIFVKNCNHILFIEHEYDNYEEYTSIGNLWGAGYIPNMSAAAGDYFLKFFNSQQFRQHFSSNQYSERIFFDHAKHALFTKFGIQKISHYNKASRIKTFIQFNSQLAHKRIYMPSKGMYTLNYVLNTFTDAEIYVTGFDGIKTKNYWRKEDTPLCVTHSSAHEMIMYKKLLRAGKIREL